MVATFFKKILCGSVLLSTLKIAADPALPSGVFASFLLLSKFNILIIGSPKSNPSTMIES